MIIKRKKIEEFKIRDIVKNIVREIDAKQLCTEDEILTSWVDVVGVLGARHSKPTSLQKQILKIAVDSSSWIQELNLKKRQILKKLQSCYGKDKISNIRFQLRV
jgi:predicted nucleic acid-binding Zn ribbon protein